MRVGVIERKRITAFMLLAALLILAMSPLAASVRAYEMQGIGTDVTHIEFRLENRPWAYLDPHDPKFFLFNLDTDDVLEVRQASEGGNWGDILSYRLDADQKRWVSVAPATGVPGEEVSTIESGEDGGTAAGLDLVPSEDMIALPEGERQGHPVALRSTAPDREDDPRPPSRTVTLASHALFFKTTPSMDHLYAYSYGGGVDVTLSPSHTRWTLSLALAVQHARSANGWADAFLILDGIVEAGWKLQLSQRWQLVPSLSVGVLMHYTIDGNAEDAWYSSLLVGAGLSVTRSLSDTLQLFVKPTVRLVVDETRVGFMYGTGVGLNVLL